MRFASLLLVVVAFGCEKKMPENVVEDVAATQETIVTLPSLPDFRGHQFEQEFKPTADMQKSKSGNPDEYVLKLETEGVTGRVFFNVIDGKLASLFFFYKSPSYGEMLEAYEKKTGRPPKPNLIGKQEWAFENGYIQVDREAVAITSNLGNEFSKKQREKASSDAANAL